MALTTVLSKIPKSIVSGNSVSWKWSNSKYPAPDWVLSYVLVNPQNHIKITANADGTGHVVEVLTTESESWEPGEYTYQAFIANATTKERNKVGSGVIKIETNFETQTSGHDGRSYVKQTLDSIRAVITGKVSHDRASYSINGRSLSSYTWEEILGLERTFAARYQAELRANRKKSLNFKFRFK